MTNEATNIVEPPKVPTKEIIEAMAVCDTSAALRADFPVITMQDVGDLARRYLWITRPVAYGFDESTDEEIVKTLLLVKSRDLSDQACAYRRLAELLRIEAAWKRGGGK